MDRVKFVIPSPRKPDQPVKGLNVDYDLFRGVVAPAGLKATTPGVELDLFELARRGLAQAQKDAEQVRAMVDNAMQILREQAVRNQALIQDVMNQFRKGIR
jgi:hypothetical protein